MTTTLAPTDLEVTPLSGSIGAEIHGVDLRDADDETIAQIRQVWLDHKVVFFPGQHLDEAEHQAFAARFGELTEGHPVVPSVEGYPNVFEIDYTKARELYTAYGDVATKTQGIHWHTDVTFVQRPPAGSILRAVVIPTAGGDTAVLRPAGGVRGAQPGVPGLPLARCTPCTTAARSSTAVLERVGEGKWEGAELPSSSRSSTRSCAPTPRPGAKVLFVNPGFTSHIVELERPESDALLGFLYEHSVRPEFVVRYHWTEGDLGFWDNRATQHSVVGDFGDQHRVIQRVTIKGDEPV